MSIVIKEFLADPTGPDTGAEYITLINTGDVVASLSGWSVRDKSGKSFNLSGYELPVGKQLRLFSSATKITLNNSDESVTLVDASGKVVDELALVGKATSGQPTMRLSELTAEVKAQLFDDLAGKTLPAQAGATGEIFMFWFITAALLALAATAAMRTIKEDENVIQEDSQPGWNG